MMGSLLFRSSLRHLARHPWLLLLSVLGVAVGVSVVVGIDLTNHSATRAFRLSADAVTGTATHQIRAAVGPVPDTAYVRLATSGIGASMAPVIEGYARLPGCDDRVVRVLGIDPLADGAVRGLIRRADLDLGAFLTRPVAYAEVALAIDCALDPGRSFDVSVGGVPRTLLSGGRLEGADEAGSQGLSGIVVVDVSTAQEVFGMPGGLTRIDLRIPEGEAGRRLLGEIQSRLPRGLIVELSRDRSAAVASMTRAFEVNLTALSLLALVVGMFLIYNTMTFSVVQRRTLIGRLRAVGVSRRQVFTAVLAESLVIGVPATIMGLALGMFLARGLIGLASQTINDLYFVVAVSDVHLSPIILAKGSFLGIGATVLSALRPAFEATSVEVASVLRPSALEVSARSGAGRLATLASGALVVAALLIAISEHSIAVSYAGLFFVIVAFVFLNPVIVRVGCESLRRPLGFMLGMPGRMAPRAVAASMSRTGVAMAALAVAVASSLAVGVMVESFRGTVEHWLSYSLQADIYVQPPRTVYRRGDTRIQPDLATAVRALPGVREAYSVSHLTVQSDLGPADVVVIEPGPMTPSTFRLRDGPDDVWDLFADEDAVLLSEPFSFRQGRGVGDELRITTRDGVSTFRIAGVFVDYASDSGTVLMSRNTFLRRLGDPGVAGLALYVGDGVAEEAVIRDIDRLSAGRQELVAQSNASLRSASLDIFDRTFAITAVLRVLAVIVAFIGVLTALMALQLERSRELAVLRANGMTPGQVWGYVTLQTSVMGLLAGLLALPLGYALAALLIHVINRRSFGWTLEMNLTPMGAASALFLALAAAVLAGLYPAWKMSRTNPALALRYE